MIVKIDKTDTTFVQIDNRALRDKRLSWKAKGVLAYLLSNATSWEVFLSDLVNQSTDGMAAVRSALEELKQHGYADCVQPVGEDGKFEKTQWTIREEPRGGFPHTEKPQAGNPHTENRAQTIASDNKTKETTSSKGNPLHQLFVKKWCEKWKEVKKTTYIFSPKDGKQLKDFLVLNPNADNLSVSQWIDTAVKSWKHPDDFERNLSAGVASFVNNLARLTEVTKEKPFMPNGKTSQSQQPNWMPPQ